MSTCPSKPFWWADGLWIPKEIFSVTFELDGIDLGRYSAPTVAASFFLCLLMAERFAFSEFQDIVSLLTPVTSCSFLWGMNGEGKKKFKSVPRRVKAMLCTSSYPANTSTLTLEQTPLSHAPPVSAHKLPNSTSWWKKFPPKRLPTSTLRLLRQGVFAEAKCYHSGHSRAPTFASNELSATRASSSISSSLTRRNGEAGC